MQSNQKAVIYGGAVILGAIIIAVLISMVFRSPETYTGTIEVAEVNIGAIVPGRLDSLTVKQGDKVKKGELLFLLDTKILRAKEKQATGVYHAASEQYKMALEGARKEQIEMIRAKYETAKAQYEFAEKSYKRMQSLYADSMISQQQFDEVKFKYTAAKKLKDEAEWGYKMAQKGARDQQVRAAEDMMRAAQGQVDEVNAYLDDARMTSPVDGIVYKKYAVKGEIVAQGFPVLSILDPSDVWMSLYIPESSLNRFALGSTLKGYLPALDREIEFEIYYLSPLADFATWKATTDKGTFDLRSFEVQARPVEGGAELLPGMSVIFSF